MHTEALYIGYRKGIADQWVSLRPIPKVYTRKQGFEGGRRRRRPWWIQEVLEEVLWATLSEALWDSHKYKEADGVIETSRGMR